MADLYRYFDAEGNLLYIGISLSAICRMNGHKNTSEWFDDVATVTIEKFQSQEAAAEAEGFAIKAEKPLHNRVKTPLPNMRHPCRRRHDYPQTDVFKRWEAVLILVLDDMLTGADLEQLRQSNWHRWRRDNPEKITAANAQIVQAETLKGSQVYFNWKRKGFAGLQLDPLPGGEK